MTPQNLRVRELQFICLCIRKQPDPKLALCIATLRVSEGTAYEKHSLHQLWLLSASHHKGHAKPLTSAARQEGVTSPGARLQTPTQAQFTPSSSAVTPSSIAPRSAGAAI